MVEFDVVSLPEADHVDEGDVAPDFTRPLVNGEYWQDRSLSELTAEGPVALVFYPADGTFPATYVWNEIRDRGWGTDAIGGDLTVVGVSISTPYEHRSFLADRGIDYELFSDPDAGVAERYGVENDLGGMAGIVEHRPAVYLIEPDRTVAHAWVAEEWPEFPDYDAIEAEVEALVD